MSIRVICFCFCATLLASALNAACLKYEPAKVSLIGVVEPQMFYGPPNYGENPATDEKDVIAVLKLSEPIQTCSTPNSEYDRRSVAMLQMVFHEPPFGKQWNGKRVTVVGKLVPAETGHHYTPVLIDVSEVGLEGTRP